MESIVKASEKGKIKVKQVVDNTAKDVEIMITSSRTVAGNCHGCPLRIYGL